MTKLTRVGVLYGGRSAEHDVSILSARNVVEAIDKRRFEVVPIAVTRAGQWLLNVGHDTATLPDTGIAVALLPGGQGRLIGAEGINGMATIPAIDVLLPVLHGPFGEDGSVQGYAEVADVAYAGCGIFALAACMDKVMTKRLLAAAGLPVARARCIERANPISYDMLVQDLGSPIFLKPANQGSSVGVSRVGGNGASFAQALEHAFHYDDIVLAEEFMDAREIECAVLERADGSLVVSDPGEIVTAKHHDFYSYEAKYLDADGALVQVPADVPQAVAAQTRSMTEAAFRALGCAGMARIDFFLKQDGALVINEINTIPGFTDISMYAKALAAGGISYSEVITTLIERALARHARRRGLAAAA